MTWWDKLGFKIVAKMLGYRLVNINKNMITYRDKEGVIHFKKIKEK